MPIIVRACSILTMTAYNNVIIIVPFRHKNERWLSPGPTTPPPAEACLHSTGPSRGGRKITGNKLEHWCVPVLPILYSGCILECRDKPTSHCLTNFYTHGNNLIPISVLKILVHIVLFVHAFGTSLAHLASPVKMYT